MPRSTHLRSLALILCTALSLNPAHAQEDRTYYTDDAIAHARAKLGEDDAARRQFEQAQEKWVWLLEMDDQALWDYIPPVDQRRALNVAFNVGCPVHGQEVYAKAGPYPWIMTRELPFKVTCPVGGEVYPSNDFLPWHHGGQEGQVDTTQQYVDDGTGYVGPDGQHYHFVAHYIFWQRWRGDVVYGIRHLRDAYLLTGDETYAHKAAVMLARIAEQYPQVNYAKQAVHRRYPADIPGGILDYIWENGAIVNTVTTVYDAIRPTLADDAALHELLRRNGVTLDPHRLIQDNLLFKQVNMITGGRNNEHPIEIVGNFGMYQRSLATLALVLDNDDPKRGLTTTEMLDWILWGGGDLQEALWNRVYNDGHGGESSSSYSSLWAGSITSTGEILQRLGHNIFEHPKMYNLATVWLDLTLPGGFTPSTGDSGDMLGERRVGWRQDVLKAVFDATEDPRVAKALSMIGVNDTALWSHTPVDRIQEVADTYGPWSTRTRHLPGYGMAMLESPSGEAGLSLYYGYAGGGHGHRDRLNIEMFALDRPILPDHGYPSPLGAPKNTYWSKNSISHYSVIVDRAWQQTHQKGQLHALVGTPVLQMADASAADAAYPGTTGVYRRTSLLIEHPSGLPYLLDLFRVEGGSEHAWSFHGPPLPGFETRGLDLGPVQEQGTLAGPDVPFEGTPTGTTHRTSGFQYLFNVRRAQAPAIDPEGWGATWSDPDGQKHLTLTVPAGPEQEVVLADAEPEFRPNFPKTMPYLLAFHRQGETADGSSPLRSSFIAVAEPHQDEPGVQAVRRLEGEAAGFAVGVAVDRTSGQDIVVSHLNPDDTSRFDVEMDAEVELHGRMAHLALDDTGGLRAAAGVDVQRLTSLWLDLTTPALMRGKVTAVDYDANTITLDADLPGADALVGQTIVLGNDAHNTSYEIAAVDTEQGRTVLHFGRVPMIVGLGHVIGVDGDAGTLTTDTTFSSYQVDGGEHTGRYLLDAAYRSPLRITGKENRTIRKAMYHAGPVTHSVFTVDTGTGADVLSQAFEPGDGPRSRFWIGDVGVGDRWTIPAIVTIQRQERESDAWVWQVTLTAPVELSLPAPDAAGGDLVYRDAQGAWQPLSVQREGGRLRFTLSPAQIVNGQTVIALR